MGRVFFGTAGRNGGEFSFLPGLHWHPSVLCWHHRVGSGLLIAGQWRKSWLSTGLPDITPLERKGVLHYCGGKREDKARLPMWSLHWVCEGDLVTSSGDKVLFCSLPSLTPPWRSALHFAFYTCNLYSSLRKKPSRLLASVELGLQYFFLWSLATVEQFLTKSFLFLPGCPFSDFWLERAGFCWGSFVFLSLAFGGCWLL